MGDRVWPSWRRVAALVAVAAAVGMAGCQEQLEGGAGCPLLCPAEPAVLRDTVLDAIELDTMLVGFPVPTTPSNGVLVATRGDSLVTRGILRFDVVPRLFAVNNSATSDTIRAVDSTFLHFRLDSSFSRARTPVTIEAYDVDTTDSDSVSTVLRTLFRPDRLLGTRLVPADSLRDSLRIRLNDALVAGIVRGGRRLRVGIAVRSSESAQLRIITSGTALGALRVQFDPRGDTVYAPLSAGIGSNTPTDNADFALAYQAYSLLVRGNALPPRDEWAIGGMPGRRVYLRFRIPANIQDSSTIVRAQLLLTQRRSPSVDGGRGYTMVSYIGNATDAVTDLSRAAALASFGLGLVDTLRVTPADSGLRTLSVVPVIRSWRTLEANVPRAIVLGGDVEGGTGQELRFASLEAAPGARPRLRITYQPRREFGLP